jgi:hypothetical protein
MFRKEQQRRFGSAHVIAIAALFFALGGGAYAAVQSLPANSVGTKQLQRHSVTAAKLAPSANRHLMALTPKQKKELIKIIKRFSRRGPTGPQGPRGETGVTGTSDTYIAGAAGGGLTSSFAEVTSTTVPAGQYLIQAKTVIFATSENAAGAGSCFIAPEAGAAAWDGGTAAFPAIPGVFSSGTISLAGADSFSATTPVVLFCRALSGTLSFGDARVWATKVGSVHGLPVPVD